jgi:hypothetical protein
MEIINRFFLGAVIALFVLAGCGGGGTTGTSQTSELSFTGAISDYTGAPQGDVAMQVTSFTSGEVLIRTSSTPRGGFEMTLPGSESAVVVEMGSAKTPPIKKQLEGSSAVSAKLTLRTEGAISVDKSVEAQVVSTNLCSAFITEANQIVQVSNLVENPCTIQIHAVSATTPTNQIIGSVYASCRSVLERVAIGAADSNGNFTVNVAPIINRGCSLINVTLTSTQFPGGAIVFPVVDGE